MVLIKSVGIRAVALALALAALAVLPAISIAQQEGIVLYLPLSEGSGEVAGDHSGNGKDGALFGGAKWVPGKYGSGVYLDGKEGYIEIPNVLTEAGTIEFWFKPDWSGDDSEDYRIFDASQGGIYFFISKGADHADITPQNFGFYFEDAVDADWQDIEFDPAGVINAGEWYHIAATWEFGGGFAFLYLNGVQIATSPNKLGGFPPLNPKPRFGLEVIQYVASKNGAAGVIDEIAIYNRALIGEEIVKDMLELDIAIQASGRITSTWGYIKSTYSP